MKSISEYLQLLAGYMKANAANYHITRDRKSTRLNSSHT